MGELDYIEPRLNSGFLIKKRMQLLNPIPPPTQAFSNHNFTGIDKFSLKSSQFLLGPIYGTTKNGHRL